MELQFLLVFVKEPKSSSNNGWRGKHAESYVRLPKYIEVLKEKNPGTIASCITEGPDNAPTFKRLFISFEAMMTGFKRGCRPFIGVDGCFLKGPTKEYY